MENKRRKSDCRMTDERYEFAKKHRERLAREKVIREKAKKKREKSGGQMNWKKLGKGFIIFTVASMIASGILSLIITLIAFHIFNIEGIYLTTPFTLFVYPISIGVGLISAWYFTRDVGVTPNPNT